MYSLEQLLNEHQVAELLGFHVQTLRNHRTAGVGLPYLKIGRSVRYQLADIQDHLSGCRIVPGGNND
jgi:hypothetical protein